MTYSMLNTILRLSLYNKPSERFTSSNEQAWMVFRDHLPCYRDTFLSVNDMWVSFKTEVIAAIEKFIPTKMTKTKI